MRIARFAVTLAVAAAMVASMAYLGGFGRSRSTAVPRTTVARVAATDPHADFATRLLADTRSVWSQKLAELGGSYPAPGLVEFSDHVDAACASASVLSGPFFCPRDDKVYVDLTFFSQLATQFPAQADAAKAYVIAHEVGHHVQALLGATEAVQKVREHSTRQVVDRAQLAFELQADCYAGIWARAAAAATPGTYLDVSTVDEALRAASTVGEALQQRTQALVSDPFTHGTIEQRSEWFKRGFGSGKVEDCNAFAAPGAREPATVHKRAPGA